MNVARTEGCGASLPADECPESLAVLWRQIEELDADSFPEPRVADDRGGGDEIRAQRKPQAENGAHRVDLGRLDERASEANVGQPREGVREHAVLTEPDLGVEGGARILSSLLHPWLLVRVHAKELTVA